MNTKQSMMLVCAMLLLSVGVKAAPPAFSVTAPGWSRLAVAKNADGLNIRKGPSTSFPRLVYNETEIEDYDTPVAYYSYWSATPPKGSVYALKFTGPNAVASEKEGWLEILKIGPKEEENGWVSAQYCDVIAPEEIKYPENKVSGNFIWLTDSDNATDGVYGLYMEYDEMNGWGTFYLGRLTHGMLVCPYQLYCSNIFLDNDRKPEIRPDENGSYALVYNSAMIGDEMFIDLRKFPVEMINYITSHATKSQEKVLYLHGGNYYISVL